MAHRGQALNVVDIVWWTSSTDAAARGYWDQGLVEDLVSGRLWPAQRAWEPIHHDGFSTLADGTGAVVVCPGGKETDAAALDAAIVHLPWVLVIITTDEGGGFPWRDVTHPNMAIWVQTPAGDTDGIDVVLPVGYPPHRHRSQVAVAQRPALWAFLGQMTHHRRDAALDAAMRLDAGDRIYGPTDGFAKGIEVDAYMAAMSSARFALCPGGVLTPDTFRVWEALIAGCEPIVDARCAERDTPGYWDAVFAGWMMPPWPIIEDWSNLGDVIATVDDRWSWHASRAEAHWMGYRRHLMRQLEATIRHLRGGTVDEPGASDLITIVVTMSPIPSHPSIDIIAETLASLGDSGLGGCDVLVLIDGVRGEQTHRMDDYDAAIAHLLDRCRSEPEWSRVVPIISSEHMHQAMMTKVALDHVRTPLIAFIEHDCPVIGSVPWDTMAEVILGGDLNVIRLHHEASVLDEHLYLMIGEHPSEIGGLACWETMQWSQRPHLASTAYYRHILAAYFTDGEATMIEERMHSVLQCEPWGAHRVAIYHPDGIIKRSTTLDGRGDDPKWVDS